MTSLNRNELKPAVERASNDGIFIGTSSWKYPGWRGLLYDEQRYIWRGKFAESRFEKIASLNTRRFSKPFASMPLTTHFPLLMEWFFRFSYAEVNLTTERRSYSLS